MDHLKTGMTKIGIFMEKKKFFVLFFFVCVVTLDIGSIISGHRTTFYYLRSYLQDFKSFSNDSSTFSSNSRKNNSTITILWYAKQGYFSGNVNLTGCKFSNCILTENKTVLEKSAAVLFAYRDMWNKVPFKKRGQIWVIVNIESPAYDVDLNRVWDNKFDWSMTYRQDGEIFLNYKTFRRTIPLKKNYSEIFKNKTKYIAWAVGSCQTRSRRELYVRELRKYINIDIYGDCGKVPCPNRTLPGCHEVLSQKYKFYLGFENSLCKDYVTEKIFHTFLDNSNAVYVYRGAPNVKSILPPKTYIDVNDYENPKRLAEYLLRLGSNESEYISYLKESDKYHIDNEQNYYRSLCDLCELLNTYKTKNLKWTGKTFNSWYRQNVCVS
ncbi:glycoprotein 3-alpha-L-fucosyltransferase [Mytilus galloprovincialis]|uniref:Fucosyltransferase n=1 Tax=Mytilus galloprovincialis TaxID=29158 RepID=A0A8B6HUB6_MYTGA|nr:glycoprotein 3-alpha-L-fucosyltransferase [Mytilus galloprovincialis]